MNKKQNNAKRRVYIKMAVAVLVTLTLLILAIVVAKKEGEWLQGGFVGGIALILLAGFAIYGYRQLRNVGKGLPAEDERSRKIMNLAAARAYYISIYWFLAIMWSADYLVPRGLTVSSACGLGIAGMAVIFLLSWVYFNRKGEV